MLAYYLMALLLITYAQIWHRELPIVCNYISIYFFTHDLISITDSPSSTIQTLVALNEVGKVKLTWIRPSLGTGQIITSYSVQYRRRGYSSYTTRSVSGSSTTAYTITNLNLGTVYEVRVASVGPLGLSGYCCGNGKQVTTYNCE